VCVCVVVGSALIATHAPHRRDCAPTSYLDSPSCRSNATRQSVLPRAAAIALQLPAKPSPITFETCLPAALHVPSCTVTTCTSPPQSPHLLLHSHTCKCRRADACNIISRNHYHHDTAAFGIGAGQRACHSTQQHLVPLLALPRPLAALHVTSDILPHNTTTRTIQQQQHSQHRHDATSRSPARH
jgi:hypothetical protein